MSPGGAGLEKEDKDVSAADRQSAVGSRHRDTLVTPVTPVTPVTLVVLRLGMRGDSQPSPVQSRHNEAASLTHWRQPAAHVL